MADHDTHDHTGVPGVGTDVADIIDLPTAETDDTLVLAPDGAGGVEFRAETGGSLDSVLAASTGEDIADALSGAAAPDSGNVFATMADVGGGPGGGGLVLLEQHTASSSATLDFTAFISSTYDDYEFHFINIVAGTSTANVLMRMGTGGGPTYDAGANYGSASNEGRAGGMAASGSEGGATSIMVTRNGMTSAANWQGLCGDLRLFNPGGALYKATRGKLNYISSDPFRIFGDQIGSYESTTAVTAVRFLMSSGNIASGTIRVYGIAK